MSATPSATEVDRLRLLYDLGCAFAARTELDELIPFVIPQCRDVLGAEGASILLLDAETGDLVIPYVAERSAELASRLTDVRVPAGQGIAGAVVRDEIVGTGRRWPRFSA